LGRVTEAEKEKTTVMPRAGHIRAGESEPTGGKNAAAERKGKGKGEVAGLESLAGRVLGTTTRRWRARKRKKRQKRAHPKGSALFSRLKCQKRVRAREKKSIPEGSQKATEKGKKEHGLPPNDKKERHERGIGKKGVDDREKKTLSKGGGTKGPGMIRGGSRRLGRAAPAQGGGKPEEGKKTRPDIGGDRPS